MTGAATTIRPARLSDAADIARLATELGYPTTEFEISRRLELLIPSASYHVAVAELGTTVVGWVAGERRLLLESGERAEIVGLIVSEPARRRGIGRALVAAAEAWASGQGLRAIFVRSNVARLEAHPFYESIGYSRTKTQHAYAKPLTPG